MSLANLSSYFLWPTPISRNGVIAVGNVEVWSVTPRIAFIFQCPKAGTLDGLEFLVNTVFSSQPMQVSFQDLSGSDADGVVDQFATFSPGSAGWKSAIITSDGTTGGVKRTVTQGQWLAAVFQYTGTTADINVGFVFDNTNPGPTSIAQGDGYLRTHNGTSWNSTPSQQLGLNMALRYDDGSYGQFLGLHVPLSSVTNQTLSSSSTPDEIGITFDLIAPLRVLGAWLSFDQDAAFDVVIYGTDGTTPLATTSPVIARGTANSALGYVRFSSPVDLAVGSGYRLVLKPTTTTNLTLTVANVNSSGLRAVWPGGSSIQQTSRTDAGAWTQTNTKLPQMGLIVSGLEVGGSSGGSTEKSVAYA